MYDCERCGSSFSPLRIASPDTCPRCYAREGLRAPLSYSLFKEAKPPVRDPEGHSPDAAGPVEQNGATAIG